MALIEQLRSWPMFAALGAGLVLTAVAAGAGGAPAAVLVGCGVAALAQGAFSLREGQVVAPVATVSGCLALLAGSAAVVVAGVAGVLGIAVLPLLAADLFVLVVAFGAVAELRRRRRDRVAGASASATAREPRRRLPVIGMVAAAALTAGLATPALAATEAGDSAVPHGQLHGVDGGHSGH
jgi:heme/copper-type cytochrome/quinol oxidase subunit 2